MSKIQSNTMALNDVNDEENQDDDDDNGDGDDDDDDNEDEDGFQVLESLLGGELEARQGFVGSP